ncbi:MAG TPA: double-strand break repair protein AddB [Alphaproteobacteria bacterium]|nr:double-strand break repair protein AddB [Alphaproteobacteria bacterium]
MTPPPPSVFNIPAGIPFADALAHGCLERFAGEDPLTLSRLTILLPTRRAMRAMREAFLRVSGGTAMLLPQFRALGDVDAEELAFGGEENTGLAGADGLDLPPPIAPLRRRFLLMRLIRAWGDATGRRPYPWAAAARLAAELGGFLDQIQTEKPGEPLQEAPLAGLAPESLAAHWRETLEFLQILTRNWPQILREEGVVDPAFHRNEMLSALARRWRETPPASPVIAAGSTGSVPATAQLLEVISYLPDGMVVLPGLDTELDETSWNQLDPGHPQYGLALLLKRLGLKRGQVRPWPGHPFTANRARAALLSEALRPAQSTGEWREAAARLRPSLTSALQGLTRIEAPAPREEAMAIALAMREVLETPGKTAALVTPDRGLARLVAVELRRWGVEVDDSAGAPLLHTPVMNFLRSLMIMAAGAFSPIPLLAVCKHRLAAGGMPPETWRARTGELDRMVLRGPRPAPGVSGLKAAALDQEEGLLSFIDTLERCAAPLAAAHEQPSCPLTDYLEALLETAENFAATDSESGTERLWRGEAGEAASKALAELCEHAPVCADIAPEGMPDLLAALLEGQAVRPHHGRHPRLFIWGPLEARLQHASRMILGGLNEGVWPAEANTDPWLSRPMRSRFGLPAPERRIGLAAHDFAQGAACEEVILTRSRKTEGAPSAPSRWWLRIENLLRGIGAETATAPAFAWTQWAEELDKPDYLAPESPPRPTPMLAARPRRLSVTEITTLIRDPYAIYARHILGLRPLEPIDSEIGASDRGKVIHQILEHFTQEHPELLAPGDYARLLQLGDAYFDALLTRPGVRAFWKPRFADIAVWFHDWDRRNRLQGARPARLEAKGEAVFMAPGGAFRLTARADRIDRIGGHLAIYDYKTGVNPKPEHIKSGFDPQLPLEAAIAEAGEFEGVPKLAAIKLAILRIRGIDPPGKEEEVDLSLSAAAWRGLQRLIAHYDRPSTPYVSRRAPADLGRAGAYDHLARVKEWSVTGGGEEP